MSTIIIALQIVFGLFCIVLVIMAPIALINAVMLNAHLRNVKKLSAQLNLKSVDAKPTFSHWVIAPAFYTQTLQGSAQGLGWKFQLLAKRYLTSRQFIPQMTVLAASGLSNSDFILQIKARSAFAPNINIFKDAAESRNITTNNVLIDKNLFIHTNDESKLKKLMNGKLGDILVQMAKLTKKFGQGFGVLILSQGVATYYELGMMSSNKHYRHNQLAINAIVELSNTLS